MTTINKARILNHETLEKYHGDRRIVVVPLCQSLILSKDCVVVAGSHGFALGDWKGHAINFKIDLSLNALGFSVIGKRIKAFSLFWSFDNVSVRSVFHFMQFRVSLRYGNGCRLITYDTVLDEKITLRCIDESADKVLVTGDLLMEPLAEKKVGDLVLDGSEFQTHDDIYLDQMIDVMIQPLVFFKGNDDPFVINGARCLLGCSFNLI